jgi:hypothetical protein
MREPAFLGRVNVCDILNINYKLESTISLNTPLIIVEIILQLLLSIDFQQQAPL